MWIGRKMSVIVPLLFLGQLLAPAITVGEAASTEYIMLAPKKLYLGTESSVSISSLSSKTGKPVDRQIVLSLAKSGEKEGLGLFEGRTGPDGHLIARFQVPAVEKGAYELVLTSQRGERISGDVVVADSLTVMIETDKPIYKPGQTIYGRVIALSTELKPVAIGVNVSISDSKGLKIFRKDLRTNQYGVAEFSLVLAREVNLGTWRILANAPSGMSTVDIRVEKYVLPKFKVEISTPKDWFLVDEKITGEVRASYFFGKPVSGMLEVRAYKYLADWEEYATFRAELKDGAASFELPQANYLAGTLGSGGLGSVVLNVTVVDGAGHEEKESKLLKIASSPTVIQLIPSSETVKPGLPLDLLIVTETPGGEPLDKNVELDITYHIEDGQDVKETRQVATFRGMAMVDINVPEKCTGADIKAHVTGETSQTETSLNSAYSPGGYFVHIKQASPGEVEVGDSVSFEVLSTSKRAAYYDVVAGGRTVFSGYTSGGYISFKVTPSMVPRAKVVAYVINPNMEVSADCLPFDVKMVSPVGLSATFSEKTAAPGDSVTLDLRSSAAIATMIGISIVDESVYALNEGRLNLKQIFDDLEKIFMEPQAEAHPEGQPRWWGTPRIGAKEVFDGAGVQVITSKGVEVPVGIPDEVIRFGKGGDMWALEAADNAAGQPQASSETGGGLAEVERIRQFFPETWYWNPMLMTDSRGKATVELTVPDTITTWRLHAVSTSPAGVGITESSLRVFQDFFIEPDLPYAVTRGEEFPVIVQVYNYLNRSQTVQLEITKDAWFDLVDDRIKVAIVPANSVAAVAFTIRPKQTGQFKVEITARTTQRADAVRKDILVEAEGTPREIVRNAFITQENPLTFDLSLPEGIVNGSARILLSITPSLVGQTINGMEDLLGMPYGCGEQNMMFMAPDLEILRYLDATDQAVPEVRAKAELYLTTGYQRELTFRRDDGSFSAFGQNDKEGSLFLTAFVLGVFSESREVLAVDEKVLADAASWIEVHQNSNGSFSPVGFVCHQEMMGGLGSGARTALTAFVAIALADYGSGGEESLGKAIAYLEDHGMEGGDTYSLALSALALEKVGSPKAEQLIQRLLDLAQTDENGMYWSAGGEKANAIETTAYGALALMLEGRSEAEAAIRWLASQRNSFGGFCSTQDTVWAMKALMTAARLQSRSIDSSIEMTVDGSKLGSIQLTRDNFDVLQLVEIPQDSRELQLNMKGDGKVMVQLVKRFNVPGEVNKTPEFDLDVKYNTTTASVDDVVGVLARVRYNGAYNSTGMLILDIAIPTGFVPLQATLDEVVSKGLATRVEVAGRKVIFYIDDLKRGDELEIPFSIKALFPVKAKGGTSQAYSYYKPDVRTEAKGSDFEVQGNVESKYGPQNPSGGGGSLVVVPATPTIFPLALLGLLLASLALASLERAYRRK